MATSADSMACPVGRASVFCFVLVGKVIIAKSAQPNSGKHDANTHKARGSFS